MPAAGETCEDNGLTWTYIALLFRNGSLADRGGDAAGDGDVACGGDDRCGKREGRGQQRAASNGIRNQSPFPYTLLLWFGKWL